METVSIVRFCNPRSFPILREDRFKYEFRNDKGWHWVQRLCLLVLRKIGAHFLYEGHNFSVSYKYVDGRSFLSKMVEQYGVAFRHLQKPPTEVLIGSEEYCELIGDFEFHRYFTFTGDGHWREGTMVSPFTARVRVIPWMKGVLVL